MDSWSFGTNPSIPGSTEKFFSWPNDFYFSTYTPSRARHFSLSIAVLGSNWFSCWSKLSSTADMTSSLLRYWFLAKCFFQDWSTSLKPQSYTAIIETRTCVPKYFPDKRRPLFSVFLDVWSKYPNIITLVLPTHWMALLKIFNKHNVLCPKKPRSSPLQMKRP